MASITLTTTAPQDARLAPTFGALLGLSGNANTAQVKEWLIVQIRSVVQNYEHRIALQAVTPPSDFTPT